MSYPLPTLGNLLLHGVNTTTGVQWVTDRTKFAGWDGPASSIRTMNKPRSNGAWAGDAYLLPRHVALGGTVKGPTQAAVWAAIDELIVATSLDNTVLSIAEEGRTRWANVRREDEVVITWLSPTVALWSIQVVASDPRRFGDELSASTALPSTSGGLTVPFTVPFAINSTVVAGQVSLTNTGNIAGPVFLRIDGPVTGPVVTHVNSGRSLIFSSSIVLDFGEWITVDMERREVLANGQASRNGWVTGRGWSNFEVGVNTWSFSATAYDPASLLTVTASPAWQ